MAVTSQSTLKELVDETGLIKEELVEYRDNLKTNLENKGVDVSNASKIQNLIDKVEDINVNLYSNIMKAPKAFQVYPTSKILKPFIFYYKYWASCFEIHKDNNIYSLLYSVRDGSITGDKRMWKYSLELDTTTMLNPINEYTKVFMYDTRLFNKNAIIGDIYYAVLGVNGDNFISCYNIVTDTWTNPAIPFGGTIIYGLIRTSDNELLATTNKGIYLINTKTNTKTLVNSYNTPMIFDYEYQGKLYGRGYEYYTTGLTELDLKNYSVRNLFSNKLILAQFGRNFITEETQYNGDSRQYTRYFRFEDVGGKELLPTTVITTDTSTTPKFSYTGGAGRRCYSPDGNLVIEALQNNEVTITFNFGYDTQFL